MEFEAAEISSPGSVDTSQNERLSPETWDSRELQRHVTAPEAIPYKELPRKIELDESWHELFHKMVADTADHGKEVHAVLAGIYQVHPKQVLPFPYDIDELLLPDHLGPDDNPLFATKLGIGTENVAYLKNVGMSPTPPTIEWQNKTVPVKPMGYLHTHPGDAYPFSRGDLLWFGFHDEMNLQAALSKKRNEFLIRTDISPGESEFAHEATDKIIDDILQQRPARERLRTSLMKIKQSPDTWYYKAIAKENKRIAKACNFGLYSGEPNGPLIRQA